jgi:predicted HNH restriction endonuclease
MIRRNMIQKCNICGYEEVKDILGVHHKDGNRKNNEIKNLMIVCPLCHSLIHHKHIVH